MVQEDVLEEFVAECKDDHVGLWEIVNAVRFDLGVVDPDQVRATTLALVRALLEKPRIRAGFPAPNWVDFLPWDLDPAQVTEKIAREWNELGREPDLWEIAWFTEVDE